MDLRTSTVDLTTSDGTCDAYLAAPDDLGPYPGVLMWMDIFGPRPRLEEMAQHVAAQGYVVLLPHAFYREGRAPLVDTGKLADPEQRQALFDVVGPYTDRLTPERVESDADAYLSYLRDHDEVADGPLGVVGYCRGGVWALRSAAHRPDLVGAVAAFHPPDPLADDPLALDRLAAEVYVAAADHDATFPAEQQRAFDEALTAVGAEHTVEQYDGTQHGFTMADAQMYHEAATTRHWQALLALLDRRLHHP